jgi:hypothetical protein
MTRRTLPTLRLLPPLVMLALFSLLALLPACSETADTPADTGSTHTGDSGPPIDDTGPKIVPDACDAFANQVICDGSTAIVCDKAGDISSETDCAKASEICFEGGGCATCTPMLDLAFLSDEQEDVPGASIEVLPDAFSTADFPSWHFLLRPLTLSMPEGATSGEVTLSTTGSPIRVFTESGATLTLPLDYDIADLPVSLLVGSSELGSATLWATFMGGSGKCASNLDSVVVNSMARFEIAGRARTQYPWIEITDTFNDTESVSLGLDPSRVPDRVGQAYVACVVPHRTPEEWAVDASLACKDCSCTTGSVSGGSTADNVHPILSPPLDSGDLVGEPYDVVLDFGRDGTFDPGDLVDGFSETVPGFYAVKDLNLAGPHDVTTIEYSGGTWLSQRTYYPSDIADMGELPLVVISHGNGHLYTWYDYLGEHLASYGYVVMAHTNNTGPGISTASTTTLDNTDYILDNLDSIEGGVLEGHVDSHTIIWIGHSRGGEGVVYAYNRLYTGEYTPERYTIDDIRLVASIAPTVFYSVTSTDPHDVPYFVIAGTSDGDVTGAPDCTQCEFFRIRGAARGPVQSAYVQGADHNNFNCCGEIDGEWDGTNPYLIGRDEAQVVAKSYFLALLQTYIDGNPATVDYLTHTYGGFHPSGIASDTVVSLTYKPAETDRVVIDDYQDGDDDVSASSSGGAIGGTASSVVEGAALDTDARLGWRDRDPLNATTEVADDADESRVGFLSWSTTKEASYELDVVTDLQDFSSYTWLSFRTCQQSRHANTVALDEPLDFTVALVDADGVEVPISFADLGEIPTPYPRTSLGIGAGWADEWNTVRFRLTDFQTDGSGIDLGRIVRVRLLFGASYGSAQGRIGLDDIELVP